MKMYNGEKIKHSKLLIGEVLAELQQIRVFITVKVNHYVYLLMHSQETLNTIKSTVNSILPDSKVLLFGSRARGEADKESDFDLLIVTSDTFAPRVKMNWENKIRKALVFSLSLPFDIILQSQNEIEQKKNLTGHIVYYAMKEGVEI